MLKQTTYEPIRFLEGMDILRLVAVGLVTIQHALTLTSHDRWTTFRTLNVGQLGVAIFLGISALLASTSHRQPVPWLAQRLRRLYPPYWTAMIPCFILVWITGYKRISVSQVLSQMLGIGLFTHPRDLINVPTWFISLLILCYACCFIGRLTARPILVNLVLTGATLSWGVWSGFKWPWMHLITFFAVAALTLVCPEGRRKRGFVVSGIAVLLFTQFSIAFAYTGISFIAIGIACYASNVPQCVRNVALYSYEYYLVHGVSLLGMISALPNHPLLAVTLGIVLAATMSVMLNKTVTLVMKLLVLRSREYLPRVLGNTLQELP